MNKILTSQERANLLKEHRTRKDGRTRDRMKAVLPYDQGGCYRAIAEALFSDEETVGTHVKEYKDSKEAFDPNRRQGKQAGCAADRGIDRARGKPGLCQSR